MTLSKLLSNPKIKGLPSPAFKAYCVLLEKSKNGEIVDFTLRGLAREWQMDKDLNLNTSKNTVKEVIRELERSGLVKNDKVSKILIFL